MVQASRLSSTTVVWNQPPIWTICLLDFDCLFLNIA